MVYAKDLCVERIMGVFFHIFPNKLLQCLIYHDSSFKISKIASKISIIAERVRVTLSRKWKFCSRSKGSICLSFTFSQFSHENVISFAQNILLCNRHYLDLSQLKKHQYSQSGQNERAAKPEKNGEEESEAFQFLRSFFISCFSSCQWLYHSFSRLSHILT